MTAIDHVKDALGRALRQTIGPAIGAAIVGGALAASQAPYYSGRSAYVAPGGDGVAYCQQRFRSYDPASGTYLGNDGYRHACP